MNKNFCPKRFLYAKRIVSILLSFLCVSFLFLGANSFAQQADENTNTNTNVSANANTKAKKETQTENKSSSSNTSGSSSASSSSSAKSESDPIVLLKDVTSRVMSALKTNRGDYQSNPNRLYTLVNDLIIPYADFQEMSRWVVGRNAWAAASDSTKKAFADALKNLVIRTYARSLLNYTDQTIEFLPLRQPVEGKARTIVSSIIRDGGKGNLRLDYRLVREGDSWRVYDIIIEGISLMQGYRAQFEDEVQQGGVEAALQKIKQQKGNPS